MLVVVVARLIGQKSTSLLVKEKVEGTARQGKERRDKAQAQGRGMATGVWAKGLQPASLRLST